MENTDQHTGLKDVTYTKTQLSGDVTILNIPKFDEIYSPSTPSHPFYQYHDKPFDKQRLMFSTLPLHIGPFNIDPIPEHNITCVLRVPIKNSGQRYFTLPNELLFLKDFIEFCSIYETSFNNRFEDLFAHITVDYKEFNKGETHRVQGWHVDGFQGSKFPIKHEIEHSYLWSSTLGTEFCSQPFFVDHIDESKYLVFDEFNKQANEQNVYKCLPSNVYIFDPYMVHRSPVATINTKRLLVRITFEYQKLLDPNDTINPKLFFDVPYKYDIRNRLGNYDVPLDVRMYGFQH